jgi:sulfate adenylyltransferase
LKLDLKSELMANNLKDILISPCGGSLIDLLAPAGELDELTAHAYSLPAVQLTERALCDLELLATGAFSPLDRFMGQADYQQVLETMRLRNGLLFPIPITLPVERAPHLREGREIALLNAKQEVLAIMTIDEIYEWDPLSMAKSVLGTTDLRHPLVAEMNRWGKLNLSGPLRVLRLPRHRDFIDLRLTPAQARAQLKTFGYPNVVAFQTRNPMHRVHEELTRRASEEHNAALLLHPAVGITNPGDVDHYTRVRTYKALVDNYYDPKRTLLALLPLAMRMAGPREALWHAVIRRNYGANFLIVGRDHASPGVNSLGQPFYGPHDAQRMVKQFSAELGINVIPFEAMVYSPEEDRYVEVSRVRDKARTLSLSGTTARDQYLSRGVRLPEWYVRPEVNEILSETHQPRHQQGVCLWFTGLSCAGKSTIAEILTTRLLEHGRRVTLLDGDVVRTHLSKGLGFTKEDRDVNIRRIGFVASEVVRHGGISICAAISPYRSVRNEVRNVFGPDSFVEIFVDAPLEVCMSRDTKGMYAKAQRGEIKNFTGVDDPYEAPEHPEIRLDAANVDPEANSQFVIDFLLEKGFLRREPQR